ncbi:hypothetical protein ACLGDJ_02795 [Helicobacter pylori]
MSFKEVENIVSRVFALEDSYHLLKNENAELLREKEILKKEKHKLVIEKEILTTRKNRTD